MGLSIFSWNIRGAASLRGRRQVKEFIRKFQPNVILLLETHTSFGSVKNFWLSLGYTEIVIEEARGHAGGIWVLSNVPNVHFMVEDVTQQVITFNVGLDGTWWTCSAVYASPIPSIRVGLWDYLRSLKQRVRFPWLVLGDFNEIKCRSEVRGGKFVRNRANIFASCLEDCELLDVGMMGGCFTWQRYVEGQQSIAKKLDRVVADIHWRMLFPNAVVEVLPRFYSDHNPLLLRCDGLSQTMGQKPFRFEAAWTYHQDYHNVVTEAWNRLDATVAGKLSEVRDESLFLIKLFLVISLEGSVYWRQESLAFNVLCRIMVLLI